MLYESQIVKNMTAIFFLMFPPFKKTFSKFAIIKFKSQIYYS